MMSYCNGQKQPPFTAYVFDTTFAVRGLISGFSFALTVVTETLGRDIITPLWGTETLYCTVTQNSSLR